MYFDLGLATGMSNQQIADAIKGSGGGGVGNADLASLSSAISAGSCNICAVGTSITEGIRSQAENQNIWVNRFLEGMQEAYPAVEFTLDNLGLASRALVQYVNPDYVGTATDVAADGFYRAPEPDVWPNGSTLGLSWMGHAEAAEPDLLLINFGMNDISTDKAFTDNLQLAIDNAKSWAKVPTIILVTEMYPSEALGYYETIRRESIATKYLARANNCAVADVGALWEKLKTGNDRNTCTLTRQTTIADFEKTVAGSTLTARSLSYAATAGFYDFSADINGARFEGDFRPASTSAYIAFMFGVLTNSTNESQPHVRVVRSIDRFQVLSDTSTVIGEFLTDDFVVSADEFIDIRYKNGVVTIIHKDQLLGRVFVPSCCGTGGVGITVNSGSLTSVVYDKGVSDAVATATHTDAELLGTKTGADWNGDDFSDGGNSLNHPSRVALRDAFQPVMTELISKL